MSGFGSCALRFSGPAKALAALALGAALLLPGAARAAIFASAPAADSSASLTFKSGAGSLTGKWTSRSIAVSGDPKTSLGKLSLGTSEFDLVEQHGRITGTRPAGKGKTYEVTGFVVYGARKAPQVVLHSTSVVNGKTYDYDYFGYLMPSWNVSANQPDTFMGSVVRTDPSAPQAAIVANFIATREPAAAGGKADRPDALPTDSATPATR